MRSNRYTLRAHVRLSLPETPGVEYRHIENFPGYIIGSDGTVWSQKDGLAWKKMVIRLMDGHLYVLLYRDKKQRMCWIHRLLLEAFVGPCPTGMECRHLDGDGTNNALSNLVWGTHFENMQDMIRHGITRPGELSPSAVLSEPKVRTIMLSLASGEGASDLARQYGVSAATIDAINHGRTWKHLSSPVGKYPILEFKKKSRAR